MVWDGRVIETDLFGIPKGSRYKDEALDFIRFASSSKSLADMVTLLPNGPTRKSSLALLSDEVLAQIPNGPGYDDKLSILSDAQWWSKNHAALEEAFDSLRGLEWALMAAGVAREDVYSTLETPEGIERALKKMDAIKPGLQVWQTGREPVRLLNSGDVPMTMVWATTGAVASKEEGANFSIVWDGRVIETDLFGIPKGSRYKDEALDFIRFASSSKSLADMVTLLPNGPTRKSSLALLSDEVLAQIPNGPGYDDKLSILSDAQWWSKNHAALEEAFDAWIAKPSQQGAAGTTR